VNDVLHQRRKHREVQMTKRYRIIANPAAGRGAGKRALPLVERTLGEYGLQADVVCTECQWHAADLAQEAASLGYDVVVSMGGDGTANEVLNGLMRARGAGEDGCTMGVLCIGTGNDFAYGVGIPTNLKDGLRVLAADHRRTIDVGRVTGGLYPEGRYFGNGIGIGFDAAVGFEAAKITWLRGFASYFVAVLKTVFLYYKAPLVTIEYDGRTITRKALLVSVMNGRRMGGGFLMAPAGEPDDGLFDLCIGREVSRARIFALVPHFMRGTQATQEPVETGQSPRVVVTAVEGVLPAHADGETLCREGGCLSLEMLPRRLEIICRAPEGVA
jgi:YegS/Rv2252/BmrU family lipid kinase